MKRSNPRPVTREELRAELEKFATKEDLQAVRHDLALEIMKLGDRMDKKFETTASKADVDRLLTAIDSFAGERVAHRNKMILHAEQLRRLEVKVFGSSPPPPDED